MSWKDRATVVPASVNGGGGWRSRAEPVATAPQVESEQPSPLRIAFQGAAEQIPFPTPIESMKDVALPQRTGNVLTDSVNRLAYPPTMIAKTAQTIADAPRIVGEGIAELGGSLGYPKTGVALGAIPAMAPFVMGAASAIKGLARPALQSTGTMKKLSESAKRSADSRWFKASGGTLNNAKELGPDESLRLGRFARESGVITPLNSAENQAKKISVGLKESGQKIGELRAMGDLYGDSPEAMKIVQAIKQDIGPKYSTGIKSGEAGDLDKAIQEVLKLEPIDKLTASEELVGSLSKTSDFVPPKTQYEAFRIAQESRDYIPEYDIRRPTTFNEVAKVATDINQYAKSQSQLLQPSGAMTDAANVISRVNDDALMKVLPQEQGQIYQQNLQKYGDLSKLERMNELKSANEVGASRNSIVNNLSNRIFHRFGHQLSAQAMDTIANILSTRSRLVPQTNPVSNAVLAEYITRVTQKRGDK